MTRKVIGLSMCLVLILLLVGASPVMAAKPDGSSGTNDVISMSNGFPSGAHETLLIHGKNASFAGEEPLEPGNVVNVPEYCEGTDSINYVSGRRVLVDHLTAFDSLSESFDGDPAEVWLPYEANGYWVFARALGKPGKGEDERYIILEDASLKAYSLLEDVSNPDEVELGLGMITQQGTFKATSSGTLARFDGDSVKGQGKSQGVNITDMFIWSGLVFNPVLDVNLDGAVNQLDVIAATCTGDTNQNGIIDASELEAWAAIHPDPDDVNLDGVVNGLDVIADTCLYDVNKNGIIDYDGSFNATTFPDCEFEAWLYDNQTDAYGLPLWEYYEEEWVFTIADLVYLNQVVNNNGIKNLQIRFYPVDTTVFTP